MLRKLKSALFPAPEELERRRVELRRRLDEKKSGQRPRSEIIGISEARFPDTSTPITLNSPACPYCGVIQEPPPTRRRKCRDCGEVIFTHTDRMERKRYLLTEEQVNVRREQWLDSRRQQKLTGLRRMRDIGIDRVRILTAQDERVCEQCAELDGVVVLMVEAENLPHCENQEDGCRCTHIPVIPEAEG